MHSRKWSLGPDRLETKAQIVVFAWRGSREWRPQPDATSHFGGKVLSMLKNLAIVFGLLAGLSGCAAPYGYPGYGNPGYGYAQPAYYGYGNGPVYYGPTYPHISEHGTVQP
jgi:hypothetical protein